MYNWMLILLLSGGMKTMYFPTEQDCNEVAEWLKAQSYVINARCFRAKEE